jgi:hypothetical protein
MDRYITYIASVQIGDIEAITGLHELRCHLVTLNLRAKSYPLPVLLDLAKYSANKDADWSIKEL